MVEPLPSELPLGRSCIHRSDAIHQDHISADVHDHGHRPMFLYLSGALDPMTV